MSDLIDREEALTALRDTLKSGGKSKGLRPVTFEMIWAIKSLPSAEPKNGRWDVEHGVFMHDDIYGDIYRCSVCGYRERNPEGFNYCPNCGAKKEVSE